MEPKGGCKNYSFHCAIDVFFLSVHFSCDVSKVPKEYGKTFPNSSAPGKA
jgi:hypothetical protein